MSAGAAPVDRKVEEQPLTPEKNPNENSPMLLPATAQTTKLYKKRWLMLLIFCLYSSSSSFQWIHLNIIGNIVIKYYNESLPEDASNQQLAVDWLSVVSFIFKNVHTEIIYMVTYIPLIFPATYILNKKGLHFCSIVGSSMTAIGAWIKAAAISPDSFGLLFCGQTVVAIAQVFILEIPAHLAATWFGENEVSTATSIGVFGNQVGIAVGFLLPPVIVPDDPDPNVVAKHMRYLLLGTGVFCTLVFFLVLTVFRAKPPLPPSRAQLSAASGHEESLRTPSDFVRSLARLFTNWGFVLLMVTYGINTGSFYAISTLLNPIILNYFNGEEEHAGRIGLTIVLAGVLGSVLAGIWLDRTKTFKATTIVTYVFSMAGMLAFTLFLEFLPVLWVIYVVAGVLGFFMTGYLPVGFEFGAEITYPEPEGTSSGMLNASAQVFGIALTMALSKMLTMVSCLVGNVVITVTLLVGTGMTVLIRSDLRRQRANKHLANVESALGAENMHRKTEIDSQPAEGQALMRPPAELGTVVGGTDASGPVVVSL